MNDTVYEWCPHCNFENKVSIDHNKPIPRRIVCAECGKSLLLCSMCNINCDWNSGTDTCSWEKERNVTL